MIVRAENVKLGQKFKKLCSEIAGLREGDEKPFFRCEVMGTRTKMGTRGVLLMFILDDDVFESARSDVLIRVKDFSRIHNYAVTSSQRRLVAVVGAEGSLESLNIYHKYEDKEWNPDDPWSVPIEKVVKEIEEISDEVTGGDEDESEEMERFCDMCLVVNTDCVEGDMEF